MNLHDRGGFAAVLCRVYDVGAAVKAAADRQRAIRQHRFSRYGLSDLRVGLGKDGLGSLAATPSASRLRVDLKPAQVAAAI